MKKYLFSCLLLPTLLALFLTTSGCTKADSSLTVVPPGSLTYLALGDSYTIGQSVAAAERFPAQTVSLLKEKGIAVSDPQYIATTGWTTLDLQNAIRTASLRQSYDIVTLLIGVNDQYQGLDTAGYRLRFSQLLEKAISLAGGQPIHVFVLSIPDYSVTPFGGGVKQVQVEIDAFNRINRQVTEARKVVYIDITPISRKAEHDQGYTAADGLHPSAKQYAEWSALLSPAIVQSLK